MTAPSILPRMASSCIAASEAGSCRVCSKPDWMFPLTALIEIPQ